MKWHYVNMGFRSLGLVLLVATAVSAQNCKFLSIFILIVLLRNICEYITLRWYPKSCRLSIRFVETVHTVESKFFKTRVNKTNNLSNPAFKLMKERREMIREVMKNFKLLEMRPTPIYIKCIEEAIVKNRSSKVWHEICLLARGG